MLARTPRASGSLIHRKYEHDLFPGLSRWQAYSRSSCKGLLSTTSIQCRTAMRGEEAYSRNIDSLGLYVPSGVVDEAHIAVYTRFAVGRTDGRVFDFVAVAMQIWYTVHIFACPLGEGYMRISAQRSQLPTSGRFTTLAPSSADQGAGAFANFTKRYYLYHRIDSCIL